MARDVASIATKLNNPQGEEPILVVEIDWVFPARQGKYADKDWNSYDARIMDVSALEAQIKLVEGGFSSNIQITLSDTDDEIKTILEDNDPYKVACRVYQTFESETTDKALLFDGEITSPITWNLHDQKIIINISSTIEGQEVGYAAESGDDDDIPYLGNDAIGKSWPMFFGSCVRVPAVKLTENVRVKSRTKYSLFTVQELETMNDRTANFTEASFIKNAADGAFTTPFAVVSETYYTQVLSDYAQTYVSLLQYMEYLTQQTTNTAKHAQLYSLMEANLRIEELLIYNTRISDFISTLINDIQPKYAQIVEDLLLAIDVEEEKDFPDTDILFELNDRLTGATLTLTGINNNIIGYNSTRDSNTAEITTQTTTKNTLIAGLIGFDLLTIEVDIDEIDKLPAGEVGVIINNIKLIGTFAGNVFTITQSQAPVDTNIPCSLRPNSFPNQLTVTNSSIQYKDKYCVIVGSDNVNRVIHITAQKGTLLTFEPVLWIKGDIIDTRQSYDILLVDESYTIRETSGRFLEKWKIDFIDDALPPFETGTANLVEKDWELKINDIIYLDSDYQEKYLVSLTPLASVVEVMAFRSINGTQTLVPVPSDYYTVTLADVIGTRTVTTITLKRPLTAYDAEGWSDGLYVSGSETTIGSNTADQMEYIVDNYTNYTVDTATKDLLTTALTVYPSNFALLQRKNAITMLEEMAWQCRSAIWVYNGVVYFKYLSSAPSNDFTITDSDLDAGTLEVSLTDIGEIITKFVGEWRESYDQSERNQVILRNNTNVYGVQEAVYDFYIYTSRQLVEKSLTFWMMRLSKPYKMLEFTLPMTYLAMQPYDTLLFKDSLKSALGATLDVQGICHSATYDSSTNTMAIRAWTSVRSGEDSKYTWAWPGSVGTGTTYPTAEDPDAGGGI